ncbi:MAG: gamma-glutamyltranspeptidase, partial [Actinomycetia bacterium]|nr:gamma-glutamyltranspeptidase [Actinomycetes bacterium]
AVDAAIGANAVLSVTSSHMCGMGGDLWALVHTGADAPDTLDASGQAGSGADPDEARARGLTHIPLKGDVRAVTVPGAVDGWLALHERHGRLDLIEVFAAAISLAEHGFPVAPLLARAAPLVAGIPHNEIPSTPHTGEIVRRPGSARALRSIAQQGRSGFYGGEFGEGLLAAGPNQFVAGDLEESQARWVEPISVDAFGHRVWSPPPTSQGYLTLLGAAIADGLDITDDGAGVHLLIESAVQAGHDRPTALYEGADPAELLAPDLIARRREAIDPHRAGTVDVPAFDGDTTYLCVVDGDGMGISLINSNASGFGAHIVAGSSGIFLHDRGLGFSLEPGHPAEYGAGRRPPHTLAPALVTRSDGSLRAVLGTMGGDTQPQIVLQLLTSMLLHGHDPGRAVGQGRWRIAPVDGGGFDTWRPGHGRCVELEEHVDPGIREALMARGHDVGEGEHGDFGHAHLIEVTDNGVLAGAADPRALTGMASGI